MNLTLTERFRKRFTDTGGKLYTPSWQEVPVTLRHIQKRERATRILIENQVMQTFSINLNTTFPGMYPIIWSREKFARLSRWEYRKQLQTIHMSFSTVDALVAETGSVLFIHRNHPGQGYILLPPVVVFLAFHHQLVNNLDTLFEQLAGKPEALTEGYHLITGPSKTADIEKQLVIGMHGPESVYLLLIPEDTSPA